MQMLETLKSFKFFKINYKKNFFNQKNVYFCRTQLINIMRLTTQLPYDGIKLAATFCKRSSMIKDDRKKAEVIKRTICSYLGLQDSLITSRGRKGYVVEARQMAMFFIRKYTRLSLKQTGFEFGGLDHSTVIHAVNTVNNILSYDKLYARKFKDVENQIKQALIIA